jgi:hypothetical protein
MSAAAALLGLAALLLGGAVVAGWLERLSRNNGDRPPRRQTVSPWSMVSSGPDTIGAAESSNRKERAHEPD